MSIHYWLQVLTADGMAKIYFGCIVAVIAVLIVWQLGDMAWHVYRMRRARRHASRAMRVGRFVQRMRQAR